MLATLGGRGSETGAQGMTAELFGRETGMSNGSPNDQGDGSISEAPGTDFVTLRDRPENRTALDARKFEPHRQQSDRTSSRLSGEDSFL
jgi:hypothetical protein